MDCQMMDPAANSIKTGEDGSDETTIDMSDKKKVRLHGELSPNHICRFVPRWIVGKYVFPKRDHLVVILHFEGSDYDLCSQSHTFSRRHAQQVTEGTHASAANGQKRSR
jgi:hypothetical protein